jgi:hypothetical protein
VPAVPRSADAVKMGMSKKQMSNFKLTVREFAFYIDNKRRPILKLFSPGSYTFDSSDQSNIGHPALSAKTA